MRENFDSWDWIVSATNQLEQQVAGFTKSALVHKPVIVYNLETGMD